MKIDSDLRAAIRCAYNESGKKFNQERAKLQQERVVAVGKFIKLPRVKSAKLRCADLRKRADKAYKQHQLLSGKAWALSNLYGVNSTFSSVIDDANFRKAGGILPGQTAGSSGLLTGSFDSTMVRLTEASPQQGAQILKELGIKWE